MKNDLHLPMFNTSVSKLNSNLLIYINLLISYQHPQESHCLAGRNLGISATFCTTKFSAEYSNRLSHSLTKKDILKRITYTATKQFESI